jgi:Adenylate and Guanylate cyclase catalytic domain
LILTKPIGLAVFIYLLNNLIFALFSLCALSFISAARMESNGQRNCIHLSQATADLLIEAGKGHWIYPRANLINAKGKGTMQTYWVNLGGNVVKQQQQQQQGHEQSPMQSEV